MLTGVWTSPAGSEEYALSIDGSNDTRVLIVPALFDEANKMRRFTVTMMRQLAATGIDVMLPDLPGTNESAARLSDQTLASWQSAMHAAATHFRATHVLTIRGGCLCAPDQLPVAHYAPVKGGTILRSMLRAHVLQGREAGLERRQDDELAKARAEGMRLAGHDCSAQMIAGLADAVPNSASMTIDQSQMTGPGLWLRAEPDEDAAQSRQLAAIVQGWAE